MILQIKRYLLIKFTFEEECLEIYIGYVDVKLTCYPIQEIWLDFI